MTMSDEQDGRVGQVGGIGPVDPVETAIDDIARHMTESAPGADFTARVLARIDSSDDRSWQRRWAWVLSPIAVAAVLIFAVLMLRAPWRSAPKGTPSSVPSVAVAQPPRPEVRLKPDATHTADGTNEVATTRGARTGSRSVARSGNEIARVGPAESDLAPAPIDIEPLGIEAMGSTSLAPLSVDAMESIDVPRLDVPPIEVPTIGEQ